MGHEYANPAQDAAANALHATLASAIDEVTRDREHGASWLARHAAQALAAASEAAADFKSDGATADIVTRLTQLRLAAQRFAAARPSMVAIANTAALVWRRSLPDTTAPQPDAPAAAPRRDAASDSLTQLLALHDAAIAVGAAWDAAADAIADHLGALLPPDATVYTHSRSGTVERALLRLAGAGRIRRVIVAESRPGGEGVALARALAASDAARHAGLMVTLVPDAASGLWMAAADALIVGADSVRADGAVLNKVGTYPLALMARAEGRPAYALCETLKIAPPSWPLTLEAGDPADLTPTPIPGVTSEVTLFDRTPAEYIGAVITEDGALDRAAIARHAQVAEAALHTLG